MRRTTIILMTILAAAPVPPAAAAHAPTCLGRVPTVVGTAGDDVLRAGDEDVVDGLGGNDVIYGHRWSNALCGGPGHDWIRGTHGRGDLIDGGDGDDWLFGRAQSDTLYGGPGDDVLVGDPPGPSRWRFGASHDKLHGGPGNDRLAGLADVDELYGDEGNDVLEGGIAGDSLIPGPGDDLVRGGTDDVEGQDIVLFPEAPGPITVDLAAGTATGEGADRLEETEAVAGTPFDDRLLGSERSDVFFGGEGADYLDGRGGDDHFAPDMGAFVMHGMYSVEQPADDVVEGGPGADQVTISPKDIRAPVDIDLGIGRAVGQGTDALLSIEDASAASYSGVRVTGDEHDNDVYVYVGSAHVEGLGGDDSIIVNSRRSEIDGGDGFDTCSSADIVRSCEDDPYD